MPNRLSRRPVYDLVLGGLFLALALAFPAVFHLVGLGPVFLPMHIPVFLAGFAVAPWMAALVGLLSPLLSAVLTGMPPLSPPIAQGMMFELAVYGFVTSLLYRATRRVFPSWLGAAVAGRLAYGLAGAFVLPLFGFVGIPLLYPLTAGLVSGLPGLALQAVVVPAVVYLVGRVTSRSAAPAATETGEPR